MEIKAYIMPVSMLFFLLIETVLPFYNYDVNRLRHGVVNLLAGSLSYLINIIVFYGLVNAALAIDHGVVSLLPMSGLKIVAGLVLFDLWMYIWHRMNHEIPFLWRFHKAHHSDTAMDATTGLRFHPIEVILSTGARLPVYMLIGINPYIIIAYESLMAVVVIFHHSNIRINIKVDDVLCLLVPTPRMHRVHHSDYYVETNSNYGTVLSIWDRLFGTFNTRRDVENIRIGLERYRDEKDQTFAGFIVTPFN